VIKRIPRVEADTAMEFAPLYFQYLFKAYYFNMPTALAKIFGFYTIHYRSATRTIKQDLIVLENVFYNRKISRVRFTFIIITITIIIIITITIMHIMITTMLVYLFVLFLDL
jgi:hypothetical protein